MNSLEMLARIAKGLGPLKDKVVFVGGSTVSLYLTDPGAATVRPTEDVDCVGYEHAIGVKLSGGEVVRIFSLPYFLASKIEAFNDRGHGDFLTSPDMEDIITVLDGSKTIGEEISAAPAKVRKYLAGKFSEFLSNDRFTESLEGNLRSPAGTAARVERVKKILAAL